MKCKIIFDNLKEREKGSVILSSFYASCVLMLCILILIQTLRSFFLSSIIVDGKSMQNTVFDGDILMVSRFDKPERGEIVVFAQTTKNENGEIEYVKDDDTGLQCYFIKRIIGLEGDKITWDKNQVILTYTNGDGETKSVLLEEPYVSSMGYGFGSITVPKGCMFVMGDNRGESADSRYYMGCVSLDLILGIVPQFVVDNRNNNFWKSIFMLF